MKSTMRATDRVAIACLCAFALTSCDKLTNLADDPAKTCASPETLSNVRNLIFKGIDPKLDPFAKPFLDQSLVRIDLPTLESYDKTTKKIVCVGTVVVRWELPYESGRDNGRPHLSDEMSVRGQYTIQPQADGKGLVYSDDADINQLNTAATRALFSEIAKRSDGTARAAGAQQASPPPTENSDAVAAIAAAAAVASEAGNSQSGDSPAHPQ